MPDSASSLAEHLDVAERMEPLLPLADDVARRLIESYEQGGRLYTFGNGGSAADAQHLAEELVGRFDRTRRPLPAQSLAVDGSAVTCIANDFSFEQIFSRQLEAFVRAGDVAVGFTTSGASPNVVLGLRTARERGATTVLFGGEGPASEHADVALVVPSRTTARIQEMHVLLLHLVLDRVDAWAAGG
jgi:D-sedoheptulose 7-phosphate isomerase